MILLAFVVLALASLALGYPVALTLGGFAALFALVGVGFGFFDPFVLYAIPSRIFAIITSPVLMAIPLFITMGMILDKAGIAKRMFGAVSALTGDSPRSLAIAVTLVGVLLAASTGVVGASVVTLGLLGLPVLMRRGLTGSQAAGAVGAAGTLGQIVPPSIVLIVLGDQMSAAYREAQLANGGFASQTVTVTDLFAGALVPGLLLAVAYAGWQVFTLPRHAPAIENKSFKNEKPVAKDVFSSLLLIAGPAALIVMVLGSILTGIATPVEGGALGTLGALLLSLGGEEKSSRLASLQGLAWLAVAGLAFAAAAPWTIPSIASWVLLGIIALAALMASFQLYARGHLATILGESAHLISMIFCIVIGASIFALVLRGLGGDEALRALLVELPGGAMAALLLVLVGIFLLGFVLEFLEITYMVIPLVAPVLLAATFADGSAVNPVWLGILFALVLQTSFLTPPFGVTLFYLRSVAPVTVSTTMLYRGVVPYIAIQLVVVALVIAVPGLATFLPIWMFGR